MVKNNAIIVNWKEVNFKESWTYKMDKEYNQVLLNGVKLSSNQEELEKQIPIQNFQNAEEKVVLMLTDLEEKDLEELSIGDFNKIKDRCNEIKEGSSK